VNNNDVRRIVVRMRTLTIFLSNVILMGDFGILFPTDLACLPCTMARFSNIFISLVVYGVFASGSKLPKRHLALCCLDYLEGT